VDRRRREGIQNDGQMKCGCSQLRQDSGGEGVGCSDGFVEIQRHRQGFPQLALEDYLHLSHRYQLQECYQ